MEGGWTVYILRCADGTYYSGVTTNITRRMQEHNSATLGAKYTRSRQPVSVVYQESCASRSDAQVREAAIKSLTRGKKDALIRTQTS